MWLTSSAFSVCIHMNVCERVHGSRWLKQYYHRWMDSAQGRGTWLCWLQQRRHDILSLFLTRSLPPPSLSLSLPPPLVSDEWSSISFSHGTHDALSSSVSLFALSILCKDVETDSHSVHPPVNPSVCQMNIYYSSTFFPLINPALHCVYFLCVYLLKYAFSVPSCFNVFVCICLCQITICSPTSHPPLAACVCGVNQGQWGSAGRHPHASLPQTQPEGVCSAHPAIYTICPCYACLSSVYPSSAQLHTLITWEPTASLTSAVILIEI